MADTLKQDRIISDFLAEHETEEDMALYSALGRVVVMWGQLEYHFGNGVQMLYDMHGGAPLIARPPYSISEKRDFWKKCFNVLPNLVEYREEALKFAGDLKIASKNRHDLIHFSWGLAPSEGLVGAVRGQSIKGTAVGHEHDELVLPFMALIDFAEKIDKLQMRMLGFTLFLAGAKAA
jgi:hypothetical protein